MLSLISADLAVSKFSILPGPTGSCHGAQAVEEGLIRRG
jgi:hypothetical protein